MYKIQFTSKYCPDTWFNYRHRNRDIAVFTTIEGAMEILKMLSDKCMEYPYRHRIVDTRTGNIEWDTRHDGWKRGRNDDKV